jgi:hypothetical protein
MVGFVHTQAANEARAIRLEATTAKLRRQLARMRGEPPPPTSVADINATYRCAPASAYGLADEYTLRMHS